MKDVKIVEKCIIGQNVCIAGGVVIGRNVKIQNNISIYTGAIIEDDVFLGPSCVLTNVANPRSQIVRHTLYEKTIFHRGATIGANATIVCGIELGRYCFIAARGGSYQGCAGLRADGGCAGQAYRLDDPSRPPPQQT